MTFDWVGCRLYLPGLRGEHFSVLGMVKWLFNGLGHGIFMFLLCCFCFKNGIVTFGHMPSDLYVFGNTVMVRSSVGVMSR